MTEICLSFCFFEIFVVVVVVLLFYIHSKHLWSCWDAHLT